MTAMMTGVKTYNNAVNVDGNGSAVLSLAELSHSLGKTTGTVTTVEFGDATPAAGSNAHAASRYSHADIAYQMFDGGVLDVIAGTGNPDYDNDGNLRSTPVYAAPNVTSSSTGWMPQDLWTDLKNNTNVSGKNDAN